MSDVLKLNEEYWSTRAALVDAGVNMTDSIDGLYRDWCRWRRKSNSSFRGKNADTADLDRWWALHLAQFRSLIEPERIAARTERVRKDRDVVRPKPHPA